VGDFDDRVRPELRSQLRPELTSRAGDLRDGKGTHARPANRRRTVHCLAQKRTSLLNPSRDCSLMIRTYPILFYLLDRDLH
jgi:hypothetical protein